MYRDNSLVPKEAIRMAALGALVERDRSYSDVAGEIRQFAARIVGPSLDLLGTSIELLKFEGLVEPIDGEGIEDDAVLSLTDKGHTALKDYLTAPVRPGVSDLNKLVVALKLRFIDVLDQDEKIDQLVQLEEMYQGELNRLHDLDGHKEWAAGMMSDWLTMEIGQVEQRIAWCQKLRSNL